MTSRALPPPRAVVRRIVALALEEDLGRGDVTTAACVPRDAQGEAVMVARQELVLAGLDVAEEVFAQVDPAIGMRRERSDGEILSRGAIAARVRGPSASILQGERVALNFVQRMSGVATLARRHVDALPDGARTRIADTRKTTPGLRALERYAVRCGGGHTRRPHLLDPVLITRNHVHLAGGIPAAVEYARGRARSRPSRRRTRRCGCP